MPPPPTYISHHSSSNLHVVNSFAEESLNNGSYTNNNIHLNTEELSTNHQGQNTEEEASTTGVMVCTSYQEQMDFATEGNSASSAVAPKRDPIMDCIIMAPPSQSASEQRKRNSSTTESIPPACISYPRVKPTRPAPVSRARFEEMARITKEEHLARVDRLFKRPPKVFEDAETAADAARSARALNQKAKEENWLKAAHESLNAPDVPPTPWHSFRNLVSYYGRVGRLNKSSAQRRRSSKAFVSQMKRSRGRRVYKDSTAGEVLRRDGYPEMNNVAHAMSVDREFLGDVLDFQNALEQWYKGRYAYEAKQAEAKRVEEEAVQRRMREMISIWQHLVAQGDERGAGDIWKMISGDSLVE